MVIVLVRRCIRREKEAEFLTSYKAEKPNHPDFICETLTKVDDSRDLPEALRSLPLAGENCITYVNVARWRSAVAFNDHFKPATKHEPEFETSDRLRVISNLLDPNWGIMHLTAQLF